MSRSYEELMEHTSAFRADRFGMFIHWGLYAIPARGEWVRSPEEITIEEYQQYFDEFDPYAYDPKEWARLAKRAGMKYAVMTAKHHDGFCMFDSQYTDYKCTNTRAGRDLIREYIEAFRAEGLKVGIYYSIIDWHHPDYPAYGDRQHPMRANEAFRDVKHNFNNYLEYMHNQVREILTNYGTIDLLWFDFSYDDMTGEKWQATKLMEMIRSLQPHVIVDNRLGGDLKLSDPPVYAGDFVSPEQIIPPEGVTNEEGRLLPWEACITLNRHWGYCSADHDYKSPKTVIRTLAECVSKGGNLLLNVGPDARGRIPKESVEILNAVGEWMEKNSDSIYGCTIADFPKPEWGRYTQKGKKLYAHVLERGIGPMGFVGLGGKVRSARLLCDGSELVMSMPWMATQHVAGSERNVFITFPSAELPDDLDTVVEFELE